jgi:flagellar motor switch protein FliM
MDLEFSGDGFPGGRLGMQVPLVALEEALVRLGKPRRFSAPRRPQTKDQRQRIGRSLSTADLPVVVTVGTASLRLSEILSLAVGDVLVLDQSPSDSVSGSIEGRLRFLGKPGRVGRRLAVVVQQTLPVGGASAPAADTVPAPAGKGGPHGR